MIMAKNVQPPVRAIKCPGVWLNPHPILLKSIILNLEQCQKVAQKIAIGYLIETFSIIWPTFVRKFAA